MTGITLERLSMMRKCLISVVVPSKSCWQIEKQNVTKKRHKNKQKRDIKTHDLCMLLTECCVVCLMYF